MISSRIRESSLCAVLFVLAISVSAYAQDPTPTADTQSTTTTQTTTDLREAYWAPVGGLELDTHGTSYMFLGPHYVRPLSDKMAFVANVHLNYLRYSFEEDGGETRVGGPGVSTMAGLRFGGENYFQVGAGVGVKRRTERFFVNDDQMLFEDSDVRTGINLSSTVWVNPTERTNVHGQVHYGAEDGYIWSRLGAKRQVSNFNWTGPFANFVGGEVMAQGNEDIRSLQLGGFVELVHVKSSVSVMLRGGWKQSSFDIGEDKTGPYFAVGYYQRLR